MHQGRTGVYDEAYCSYVENVNQRRTQLVGKRAISGWKLIELEASGLFTADNTAIGITNNTSS